MIEALLYSQVCGDSGLQPLNNEDALAENDKTKASKDKNKSLIINFHIGRFKKSDYTLREQLREHLGNDLENNESEPPYFIQKLTSQFIFSNFQN